VTTYLTAEPLSRGSPIGAADITSRTAGVYRHPSSHVAVPVATCPSCAFARPAPDALAGAVAAVPGAWSDRLGHAPRTADLDAAAQVRDDLHVVANRVERLLTAPGAMVLPDVVIDAPTARSRAVSGPHLRTLLDLAAFRLATLVRSLEPADWLLRGRMGTRRVGAGDLVAAALHRSHARLAKGEPCR
jgi:hypothetical protein